MCMGVYAWMCVCMRRPDFRPECSAARRRPSDTDDADDAEAAAAAHSVDMGLSRATTTDNLFLAHRNMTGRSQPLHSLHPLSGARTHR